MYLLVTNLILVNEDCTINGVGNNKVDGAKVDVKTTKSKNQNISKNLVKSFLIKSQDFPQDSKSDFYTSGTRQTFTELRQAFIEVSILHHFNPNYHIRIETDISSYTIGEVFNQLTSDNLGG